jgi:hypothetical protein
MGSGKSTLISSQLDDPTGAHDAHGVQRDATAEGGQAPGAGPGACLAKQAKPAGTRSAVGNESTHAPGAGGRHNAPGIGVT